MWKCSLSNKCVLKVAQIAADLEMYDVAIEKYEQVAAASIDDPLLKWSLKEYCFKAGLCHLCTGVSIRLYWGTGKGIKGLTS